MSPSAAFAVWHCSAVPWSPAAAPSPKRQRPPATARNASSRRFALSLGSVAEALDLLCFLDSIGTHTSGLWYIPRGRRSLPHSLWLSREYSQCNRDRSGVMVVVGSTKIPSEEYCTGCYKVSPTSTETPRGHQKTSMHLSSKQADTTE